MQKRRLSPKQLQQANAVVGRVGEQRACHFLQTRGYIIIDSNIRYKNFEVDIIARDQVTDELVFIEVKTRKTTYFGEPSQAVHKQKLRSLERVAQRFLKESNLANDYRFDIISVLPTKIEHFQNITWK